jgi:3-oxoacyl-[acyl-carrier-protein] synthase-3
MQKSVITGTGSYIPPHIQSNKDFAKQVFYAENNEPLNTASEVVVEKFRQITGISERRYTTDDLNTSDIGAIAAKKAIDDSGINPEELDQLIVAHNFAMY